MDLFNTDTTRNLLPFDGEVTYYGHIMDRQVADYYMELMMNAIEWRNDEAVIYGKHIITRRKVAWYADKQYDYTYSNITRKALLWTPGLLQLKQLVEQKSGHIFNSCLLNLYHTGDEGMAWHSDDEKALGKNTVIASVSLGAERMFWFRHKATKEKVGMLLQHGSLLVMAGTTQSHWQHRLPPTKKISQPRVNLTFRTMIG
jgi:alkylated DNA repair dioxygenase AlkB